MIDADALTGADSLQVIARYGVGVSNVDLDAARAANIVVTNTPGANAKSVAKLTITLILNLLRPIMVASADVRSGGWMWARGISIEGKTIGIAGLGAIGREVARLLQALTARCRDMTLL